MESFEGICQLGVLYDVFSAWLGECGAFTAKSYWQKPWVAQPLRFIPIEFAWKEIVSINTYQMQSAVVLAWRGFVAFLTRLHLKE